MWELLVEFLYIGFLITVPILVVFKSLQYITGTNDDSELYAPIKRRPLSLSEQFADVCSQEIQGVPNICLFMSLKSQRTLAVDDVRSALEMLARQQPILRRIIRSNSSSTEECDLYFEIVDTDKISVNILQSEVGACEWHDAWQQFGATPRGDGLLWETLLMREQFVNETQEYINTVIFRFCHCAFDGISAMKFGGLFLKALNNYVNDNGCIEEGNEVNESLMPALQHVIIPTTAVKLWTFFIKLPVFGRLLKLVLKKITGLVLTRRACNPYFKLFPMNENFKQGFGPEQNKMLHHSFETELLVKSCRQNKSTVTGALLASSHLAFCDLVKESLAHKNEALEHIFAVNGRGNCGFGKHEHFGDFSLIQFLPMLRKNVPKPDFWGLAHDFTQHIQKTLASKSHVTLNMILSDMFDTAREQLEFFNPSDYHQSMSLTSCSFVSNVGAFEFDETGHVYKLQECSFNNLNHGLPSPLFSHYIATVNGKLTWIILYDSSKVSAEHATSFGNLCFNYLHEITSAPN